MEKRYILKKVFEEIELNVRSIALTYPVKEIQRKLKDETPEKTVLVFKDARIYFHTFLANIQSQGNGKIDFFVSGECQCDEHQQMDDKIVCLQLKLGDDSKIELFDDYRWEKHNDLYILKESLITLNIEDLIKSGVVTKDIILTSWRILEISKPEMEQVKASKNKAASIDVEKSTTIDSNGLSNQITDDVSNIQRTEQECLECVVGNVANIVDDHRSTAEKEENKIEVYNYKANKELDILEDQIINNKADYVVDYHSSTISEEYGSTDDGNSMGSEEEIPNIDTHHLQERLDVNVYKEYCKIGHNVFVPVHTLNLEHFPSGYHDNVLFDFTLALSRLTAKITVKFTSLDRPQFVPGTTEPYPCYETRGQNTLRTGTGTVVRVIKYTKGMKWPTYKTCLCPECEHSDTPSKVWWKVEVQTATHVVFDESEARQSSCRLWFDDDKSPVVKIYGLEAAVLDTERDWCLLYCATHDINIVDKLEEMVKRFDKLHEKVRNKYQSRSDADKLTIMVSHPYGCSKQVYVGHWLYRQEVNDRPTKSMSTTCTFLGSSGALVYRPGCCSGHPYSGISSGRNFIGDDVD